MKRLTISILCLAMFAALPSPAGAGKFAPREGEDKSENVKMIATFPYDGVTDLFAGGTDIDFQGKWVYAMQQGSAGGVHIIKNGKKPKKVSFFPCPGEQNDVAVVKKGLIALGYHSTSCSPTPGGGVMLVDVKNPKKPKVLGAVNDLPGGTHTLTLYPGKPYIYASPGGLPTNGGAVEQIVDISDPKSPKVAATFKPNNSGCHDLIFHFTKENKLAVCAGEGETQIWDVSDPEAPVTIGRIVNPLIQFMHSAAITHDGKYLILGDENITVNECVGGPTGAMYAYDITDPTLPTPAGYFGIDRGETPVSSSTVDRSNWCTAHLFNFIPGTYLMVASWYGSGMNVIDWSDPLNPVEIEHYYSGETNYWSAYWYGGKVWANDRGYGLDVFKIAGLKEGKH